MQCKIAIKRETPFFALVNTENVLALIDGFSYCYETTKIFGLPNSKKSSSNHIIASLRKAESRFEWMGDTNP